MRNTSKWRPYRNGRLFLLGLGLCLATHVTAEASPAAASTDYVLGNVGQIATLLRAQNYPVELKTDSEGLPYIQSDREDRPFRVYFYDCDEGVRLDRCLSAQFYAAFTIGRPFPSDRMNEWNQSRRFARGYLDKQQDPAIEMDVNLAADGMPLPLFKDTLDLWAELFVAFDDFVFATPDPDKDAKPPEPDRKD